MSTQNEIADVCFRRARKQDCARIAALYSISSDGVADYIWSKLADPGQGILEVGRQRYEREDTAFSYQNCVIAEIQGEVAGMLVAFPMHVEPSEEEADLVLAPYSRLEEDNSYYICGVALFPEYRGSGLGSRMMALAEDHARAKGFSKLSLIVFEENKGAKRLYDRLGYEESRREAIYPHPLIHHTGDATLMVKELV